MTGTMIQLAAVVILASTWAFTTTDAKCLTNRPDVFPKRNFYYNSSSLPIRIETSNRSSHQLVSRILRILLKEVLGYAKVELREGHNSLDPEDTLEHLYKNSKVPDTMINLEVWLDPGFNVESLVSSLNLVNGGPLGPSGRFGWFLPTWLVDQFWNRSSIAIDHWKALRLTEVASLFSLSDDMDLLQNFLTHLQPGLNSSHCDIHFEECHGGIYYPTQRCQRQPEECAVVIASTPGLNDFSLVQQILKLRLDAAVAWIGDHFNSFVQKKLSNNTPILFFNWIPNDLTASRNYSRMLFPTCLLSDSFMTMSDGFQSASDDGFQTMSGKCDFVLHQLTKMMWSVIRTHTPEAYHLVTKMVFSQEEMNELLLSFMAVNDQNLVSREDALEEAACRWVEKNEDKWRHWLPEKLTNKTPIYLGGMFPMSGRYWRSPGTLPGAVMAIEYVNNDPNILPEYDLQLIVQDTLCTVDKAMPQFLQLVINKTHPIAGIVGPACSETIESIAGISKHFNTIVISYSAEVHLIRNRDKFPLFLCTVPHPLQYRDVYVAIFKLFKWERVALLAEDGPNFPEYHAFLKDHFLTHSIQVLYDRKMTRVESVDEAEKFVDELGKKDVKIVILTSYEQSARALICIAFKKGMTARNGYVWFLPPWFTKKWWQINDKRKLPCKAEEMEEVIQSHFLFETPFLGPEDSEIVGNLTVKQWSDTYEDIVNSVRWEKSSYASYAYDAVMVFALGLHKLLSSDPTALESLRTDSTVEKFMSTIKGLEFSGASGNVKFSGTDRTGVVNIMQRIGENYVQVGRYFLDVLNTTERLILDESLLNWKTPDSQLPSDGRPTPKVCSVESFRVLLQVDCDAAIAIANIIGILIFVVVMIVLLIIVKKRYDAKVRRIKDSIGLPHDMSWLGLDKWEIAREHVVLNRKLGEGAFGTVYGGEALINNAWLAVAVKTLKIGSNGEEKLDFLSEAEMMKRFDHDNIVKLLGVCTRREPAYAIMEFMLHGDLKTYLLSRRHLVGQKCKEAEDVNAQALTQMALDISQGLKYLSDLKYVHRDLACRNCLVHAGKTVKIGDFGMTRPLYDSDYYRYNKRGMFPVRWMAPESLTDGIFSSASDVWSYGVLVYEIMTFGSFPYQGLSNRQVLNFVKSGHRIELPKPCPLKVQELIRTCWIVDPRQRIAIEEIIDLLEQNPLLIIPCLDDPSRAVALEGTGSLEMNLLPRSRNRSAHKWSVDHPPIHSLSLSSPEKGNSSEEESPDHIMSDPFNLLAPVSVDGAATDQSKNDAWRQFNGHLVSDLGKRPFDVFLRSSRLSRSTSTDERASIESGHERESNFLLLDANLCVPVCSTEVDESCDGLGARQSPTQMLPPSLGSRTDSDYCSQQSK